MDEAKLNAFMGKLLVDMGGAAMVASLVVGEELGLYRAMAGGEAMTADELQERPGRLRAAVVRRMRIQGRMLQEFARGVHGGDFAAGPQSGIDAHDDGIADRRLQQKLAQVPAEQVDRRDARTLRQLSPQLALDGGTDQPLVRILDGRGHDWGRQPR